MEDGDRAKAKLDSRLLDLAVVSFIFGLASIPFLVFGVFGLIALILGLAVFCLGWKESAASKVIVFAAGGGLIGGCTLVIGLFQIPTTKSGNQRGQSMRHSTALESAITKFNTEYGVLPVVAHPVKTAGPEGGKLLNILLGTEPDSGEIQNSRMVKFLSVKEARNHKNGLRYDDRGTSVSGLYDAWGNPFIVELDTKNEGRVRFEYCGRMIDLKGRMVAVYSPGTDGKPGP
jgi:hypothetical protein